MYWVLGIVILVCAGAGYVFLMPKSQGEPAQEPIPGAPQQVTLSGTFECLPHRDTSGVQSDECAFGIKSDDGIHYAVNFGQSAAMMQQFQARAHIKAEGFIVPEETLNTDHWRKYDMKGIFTVTQLLEGGTTTAPTASM